MGQCIICNKPGEIFQLHLSVESINEDRIKCGRGKDGFMKSVQIIFLLLPNEIVTFSKTLFDFIAKKTVFDSSMQLAIFCHFMLVFTFKFGSVGESIQLVHFLW